ncbi:hypothetical protein RAN3_2555 [plant metagenome]|uniref:Uncharacterized protein n=1 Tax=plant metagenome TaxID=1297885 RepID=A0A484U316_9ZZZZ
MATVQRDAMQEVGGGLGIHMVSGTPSGPFGSVDQGQSIPFHGEATGNRQLAMDFRLGRVARTSSETRPGNSAYHPRLHA